MHARLAQRCADRRCRQCWIGCSRTPFRRSQPNRDRPRGRARARRPGAAGTDRQWIATADRRGQPAGAPVSDHAHRSAGPPTADRARGHGRWLRARSTAATSVAPCRATSTAPGFPAGHGRTCSSTSAPSRRTSISTVPRTAAGPIPVRRTREMTGTSETFIAAAERAGFPWIPDLNDSGTEAISGIGAVPLNIVDGVRTGSGAAYLLPALGRPNLRLLERTRAVRLRFSGTSAVGVDVIGPQGQVTLAADRIVLSAGAIESAHLLMLSGIGDEAMLQMRASRWWRRCRSRRRAAITPNGCCRRTGRWRPGGPWWRWCSAPPMVSRSGRTRADSWR